MLDLDVDSGAASAHRSLDALPSVERVRDRAAPQNDADAARAAGLRVLLVGDMSAGTRTALDCAERLAAEGACVELYYLWSACGDVTSAERVAAELAILALEPGALDMLDRVSALQRRGVLRVGGCMTLEAHDGASVSMLAARAGYGMVVLGLRRTPEDTHRFRLHTFL